MMIPVGEEKQPPPPELLFQRPAPLHLLPMMTVQFSRHTRDRHAPPLTDPESLPFTLPPLLPGPESNQRLRASQVIIPVQIRNINIQRTLRRRIHQQLPDRRQR